MIRVNALILGTAEPFVATVKKKYIYIYIADCTVSHPIRQLSDKIDVTTNKYKVPVSLQTSTSADHILRKETVSDTNGSCG
jgi:hypothetical protein